MPVEQADPTWVGVSISEDGLVSMSREAFDGLLQSIRDKHDEIKELRAKLAESRCS